MQLSDEAISAFQAIWEKKYGRVITKEKAREYGLNLLKFCSVLIEIDGNNQR